MPSSTASSGASYTGDDPILSTGSVSSSMPHAAGQQRAYRAAPLATPRMPPGIPYIVANEAAERFSFYGMRSILVVFMTRHLRDAVGAPAPLSEPEARSYYHAFTFAVYFFPIAGALVAEGLLGKYRTILGFSCVYCAGHLALAINETLGGLAVGLCLIAVGSGGIKPCVSALLGDQFCAANSRLLPRVFGYFYLAINIGAFASTLSTPYLLARAGSHVAFGVPGVLMAAATLVFWLGRRTYAHIPPHGRQFVRELTSPVGRAALGKLVGLYCFVAVYYSLYDQTGSAWVLQAQKMDRRFGGVEWLPSQVGAVNSLLVLLLVPLFNGATVPLPRACARRQLHFGGLYALAGGCGLRVTALRKMSVGFFVLALAFAIPLQVEVWIEQGHRPSIGWQLLAYLVLTSAEVLVSVTGLEFSYTQAPRRMKSAVMALYLCATSAGNAITFLINAATLRPDGSSTLTDVAYYRLFVLMMLAAAVAFVPVAYCYQEHAFVQEAEGEQAEAADAELVGPVFTSPRRGSGARRAAAAILDDF